MSATTRRSALLGSAIAGLIGGATVAKAASSSPFGDSPDAELIALAADYLRIDDPIRRYDLGQIEIEEDALYDALIKRDRLMPRITVISAQTDQGRIAKTRVAFAVMRMADEIESKVHTDLVRPTLRDIIAARAAT